MESASDPRRATAWFAGGVVLLHVVSAMALAGFSPEQAARMPCRVAQVLTGLVLLFFLPGLVFCLSALRRTQVPLFDLLCLSFAANSVLYIAVTTGIKAAGYVVTPPVFLVVVILLTLGGVVWLMSRQAAPRVVNDFGGHGRLVLFGALGLVAFVLLTNRPFLPEEDDYWSLDTLPRIHNAEFRPVDLAKYGITSQQDSSWQSLGGQRFKLSPGEATLAFSNPSRESPRIGLWLLIEAHGEGEVQLRRNDELLQSLYAHPRFRMGEHPRNYPPPNFIFHHSIVLSPGRTTIKLAYAPDPSAPRGPFLVVTNLSNLDRTAFMEAFQSRYLIDNIGDRQEQLELARMLHSKPFLYTHSYNGTLYDGGGYTISNLPFPFYVHSFALLLMGDSVTSLNLAYLVILVGIFVATVKLAMPQGASAWGSVIALALVVALNFCTLMRFMIETLYIHPTLLLLLLVTAHFLLKQEAVGFLSFGLFACLTKGGAVFMALMLVAAMILLAGQRAALVKLFARLAGVVALAVFVVGLWAYETDAFGEWRKIASGPDYGGRFHFARRVMQGDTAAMKLLGGVAVRQTTFVLVASCFLPLACVLRADRGAIFFLTVGALGHVIVCLSDPVWTRTAPAAHHPTYFSYAANLMAVAGLRSVAALMAPSARRVAMALALIAVMGSFLGCRLIRAFYDQFWVLQSYAHQEDALAAARDLYLRRARAALDKEDFDTMALEAAKVFKVGYYQYPPSRTLRKQEALAHHFLGCSHARNRDFAKAEKRFREALQLNPELVAVHVSLAAVMLDQGNKPEAKRWVHAGLKLAPDHPELLRLARKADETEQ